VLRRVLLAASASPRLRQLIVAAPQTRAIVDSYVAGESADDAVRVTRMLRASGLLVTLDYLGEETSDAQRAAATAAQYVHLLGKLAAEGLTEDGAVEVSVKPTALGLLLNEGVATEHLERIAIAAREAGTTVTVDAEDHRTTDASLRMATALRERFSSVGSVVQAALRRTESDVRELAAPGVRVRLCKGAYAEPAQEAFDAKHDVDRSFARCLRILMAGQGYPMIATHDPRLIAITRSLGMGRPAASFEHQMLYGVRPEEQLRLAAAGAQVRVYVPYGNDWYRYLIRRLAERPANLALFLRSLGSAA
jgi:proline dehydrogenase